VIPELLFIGTAEKGKSDSRGLTAIFFADPLLY
jgi:hypothetical protein